MVKEMKQPTSLDAMVAPIRRAMFRGPVKCPACGNNELDEKFRYPLCIISCKCGYSGPEGESTNDAVVFWNQAARFYGMLEVKDERVL